MIPWPRTAPSSPPTSWSASSRSDALMMVAFSRSSRPMRPISCESEMATSGPSSAASTAAASTSNSLFTGANTLEIATDRSPRRAMSAACRLSSSWSSGAMTRPSNSWPPCAR